MLSNVFFDELIKVGVRYKNWVVLDARDSFYGENDFKKVFGERYIEVDLKGICINQAVGLALTGKIPIVLGGAEMFLNSLKEIQDNLSGRGGGIKMVGIGDTKAKDHIEKSPYMNVIAPTNEADAKTAVLSMIEGYGPIYVHVI